VSLVELLVVCAVVIILIGLASTRMVGSGSKDLRNALISISGLLELARQTAITENTHTYVAFTSPSSPNNPEDPLCAVVLVSVNGVDVRGEGVVEPPGAGTGSASQWKPITRISSLPNLTIQTERPPGNSIAAPQLPGGNLDSWSPFRLNRRVGEMTSSKELVFDRVVKFTPRGFGYVEPTLRTRFGLWVIPSRNADPTDTERQQGSLILVSGLTGNVQVVQPGEDAL
jgi:type II secretory pathway pseudopilin PulG